MAFLAPLFTAIGSFFGGIASWIGGSTILAGLARFGLGLAAKYALGSIFGPKRQAQSSQLETAYGEDIARTVAMGKVGTAGQHVYRNAYSKGNRKVQDVYVLSHFRVTRITRVRVEGKWCALGGVEDPVRGFRVQGTEAEIYVKLYRGTMDQSADAGLIAKANPHGRWTADHRGAGVAYAVVTNFLDREKLPQPWQAFFEIEGAPLYDWRKDSSIGGSGAHRWNDQSTWEFSENTVVQAYNLERGFYNGTELMVGKGVSASRLPLAEWTLAANICDEGVGTGRRYSSGLIAAAGSGITHDQNLQPLLEACAATWVEDATGEYPIVGAAQSIAFTVTDDDIMVDEPFRFSTKSTKSKLINTLAGTFQNPESFYEASPITVRIDAAALAEDRERLASSIPFDAVNRLEVADRLADIAFKASRYQANGEICIHPKFLAEAKPGRWFRWNSSKYGDRKFQVVEKRLGPFGEKAARNVYLTCQEVGDGIFDPTAYKTVPPVVAAPGEPDYDSEVSGFSGFGVQIQADGSSERKPGLRFTWAAFDDPTVVAVEIEYRPVGETDSIVKRVDVPLQVITTPDGVLADTLYEYRARIVTDPPRTTFFNAWQQVSSPKMALPDMTVYLSTVAEDVYATLRQLRAEQDDLRARMEMIAAGAADATGASVDLHTVSRRFRDATAVALREMTASIEARATVYRQPEAPSGDLSDGDIWIDTDDDNFVRVWNASAHAWEDAGAKGLATYAQADEPADGNVGDLWLDTDDNKLYRWDGAGWVEVSDSRITAQAAILDAVQASVGEISANGLRKIEVTAGSGDVAARLTDMVRATIADDWVEAGTVVEVGFTGGDPDHPFANYLIAASKLIVYDPNSGDQFQPIVIEDGVLKATFADLGHFYAGIGESPDGSFKIDFASGFISVKVA